MKRLLAIAFLIAMHSPGLFADELLPYSIKSIRSLGTGFVELIGPGRYEMPSKPGETAEWKWEIYVRAANFHSFTEVDGVEDACSVVYAISGYAERISVWEQSCDEVISEISSK